MGNLVSVESSSPRPKRFETLNPSSYPSLITKRASSLTFSGKYRAKQFVTGRPPLFCSSLQSALAFIPALKTFGSLSILWRLVNEKAWYWPSPNNVGFPIPHEIQPRIVQSVGIYLGSEIPAVVVSLAVPHCHYMLEQ